MEVVQEAPHRGTQIMLGGGLRRGRGAWRGRRSGGLRAELGSPVDPRRHAVGAGIGQ